MTPMVYISTPVTVIVNMNTHISSSVAMKIAMVFYILVTVFWNTTVKLTNLG